MSRTARSPSSTTTSAPPAKALKSCTCGRRRRGCGLSKGCRGASVRVRLAVRSSAMRTRRGEGGRSWPWIWRYWPWGWRPPEEPLPFVDLAPAKDGLGFYQERHPILHPLESTLPGVFLAGHLPGAPGHRRDGLPGERGGGPGHPAVDRAGRRVTEAVRPRPDYRLTAPG